MAPTPYTADDLADALSAAPWCDAAESTDELEDPSERPSAFALPVLTPHAVAAIRARQFDVIARGVRAGLSS